jgi:hypothetical protein
MNFLTTLAAFGFALGGFQAPLQLSKIPQAERGFSTAVARVD